ncbi:Signal peptide containing protein [Cryptosporidium tyzzeri]|nr:Signal peptide containing protein [Cryptosporidium tyzzeri]
MTFPKKEYIVLFLIIFFYISSFLCVSSDSKNKIDPTLALLPWTFNNKSNIDIRVSYGCHNWKFEDEFLRVNHLVVRIDEYGNNCTDVINVNPKWHHMRLKGVFTVIASDIYTGENLRSEIHIAKVESIKISTSSKRIRLGSLENLYAIGFDSENNTFTSLNELGIVWELENDNIISEKNYGSQILVTGSKVGSVNVHVKIIEEHYALIGSSVTIYVEDPFKIIPHIRRAPFGSLYPIHLVKEGTTDFTNFFIKEFHYCKIDRNIRPQAQILEGNKIIVENYNNHDIEAESIISTTCMDRRVDGSFFTSLIYISFPKEIIFAVQDDISLVPPQNNFNFDEFVQLYFIEGEQLAERSGFFVRILQNNELTMTENMIVFLQLKLLNYKREFLHVPINSRFRFTCKKGCNSVNITPFQTEYNKNNSTTSGFLKITGNSVGLSEFAVTLDSIGDTSYSKPNGEGKLTEITSLLKINIVRNIDTLFSNLPLVLYPGEQRINIRENITGGKGPFFFCSSNPSIAMIDFHTGLLKTGYNTGLFNVTIYDIGISQYYENKNKLSCESLKNVYGLNIPVLVSYINGFSLEMASLYGKLYENTIYTSISRNSLTVEIKAEPIRVSNNLLGNQFEPSFYNLSFYKLDTLDITKLYDPCEIVKVANLLDFQPNTKYTNDLSINDCLLILNDLGIVSYSQLTSNYDFNIIIMNIDGQKINIELKKHGNLVFDNFIEFGIEFNYNSKTIRRKIIDIGLSIFIFQDIFFVPILNEVVLSYFESSETASNNFYIEKSSQINLLIQGGLYDYQNKTNCLIEFNKFRLFLLLDNEEREFFGTQKEINDHNSIRISKLDETNKFLLECNGELAVGFFKFTMVIFDKYQSEVYRMESVLKVHCKSIDHINMFWVSQFPIMGKYTCNTRSDDCMIFHFNSNKIHRFISLAYDKNNNLLLSFNRFKVKWEIENISEFSTHFFDENELINQNIIDVSVHLGTEYYMKDVNIRFEAFIHENFEENNLDDNLNRFSIITKGIFTRPPILISPQMLDMRAQFEDYHQFEDENEGINSIGSWNLLEGQHQFGVIYGTNNFNIFFDDKTAVKYSLCNDMMKEEDIFLIKNNSFNHFHNRVHIFPFCLDSKQLLRGENETKKIDVYIEDQLILPKYVIKKKLVFSNLNKLHLVWLDRFNLNMNKESESLPWSIYFTYNVSDQNIGFINDFKVPRKYISQNIYEYIKNADYNKNIDNTLPCINENCLIDDNSRSILVVIMYDEQDMALEPWQSTEFKIEIDYKLKNTSCKSDLEFSKQKKNSLNDFSIEIINLSSTVFQIMEIKKKNIDIELVAKVLDSNSSVNIYSNSLNLKVYESIKLESNTDMFSLFPYGSPLHISFKGGPTKYKGLKLEWHIKLEKKINSKTHKDILLIRNNKKLVIEPLAEIGRERVLIKCFLTNENNNTDIFKALIFSKLINVYVDIPDKISLFSPEIEYLYLGYPKAYTIRTWNSNRNQTLNFHNSQYFPSEFSKCKVNWSISQNLNGFNNISKNFVDNKCNPDSDLVCISRFIDFNYIDRFKMNNTFFEDHMHNNVSMHDYIALIHPINIGASYLNIRLSCSFGNKKNIELELTQKLSVIKAINSVENGIWIINDSLYYIILPKEVEVKSNNKLDIEYVNNSQQIYIDTWNSNKSVVIFNEENRFKLGSESLVTISPIIISEPKFTVVELSKYGDYSIKLSLFFFNSMGIRLFPNPNYCLGINLYLIPVQNITQEFLIKKEDENLYIDAIFEESNLNANCQLLLYQNKETKSLKFIEEIKSWELTDSKNKFYENYRDSCFIIQIFSNTNKFIGSQPFCVSLSSTAGIKHSENNIFVNESNITNINSIDKITKYEFEVFGGSLLHLNPIKWKALNSTPDKLNFCLVVNKLLEDIESLLKEEFSKILNIPLTLINIIRGERIQSELSSYLNISSNKQLLCVSIDKKINPFELWVVLMKYSSIISNDHGLIWVDMNRNDNNTLKYNTSEYDVAPTWELLSSYDSVKVIENELLVIPMSNSTKYIKLRLSKLIEINLKVIPLNGQFSENDFIIVNKKYDKLHINTQFSFSIYFNDGDFINKFFNNIYYNSPISNINCEINNPILKEIYTTTPFWSLTILNNPFLLPSCNMAPRSSELSTKIKNGIVSNYYDQDSMYILPKINKTTFIIQMQFTSSRKLKRFIPVHFHPILMEPLSSRLFSNKSTFTHGWVGDTHHIEIIVPLNPKDYFEFPIQILFWFGYENTRLLAYKIKSQVLDEYMVNFTANRFQGEIKIVSITRDTRASIADLNTILPFFILLEFNSNGQKHLIDIIFKDRDNNTIESQGNTLSKYFIFSRAMRVNRHLCSILISLAILSISVFYFLYKKKEVIPRESNSSPFRKLNTQKW